MKGSAEKNSDPVHNSSERNFIPGSVSFEAEAEPVARRSKQKKPVNLWSGIWPPALSVYETLSCNHSKAKPNNYRSIRKKSTCGKNYYEGWRAALRKVMMNGELMRRILGFNRTGNSASRSDIWLLGVCYRVAREGDNAESKDPMQSEGFAAFVEDFSSRILMTYRKGFVPIRDTKYISDVNWGCMLRSSQMLVAQAFLFHKLGRSWRKPSHKPFDQSYIDILHLFGDVEDSPYSLHNLLQAGKSYGLAPGSWVGPYAMCRTLESLVRNKREEFNSGVLSSGMAIYVVSGDEDGERGGAPVLFVEDISRRCFEYSRGQAEWAPILLLIPLVLGLEKLNPRYLPLLSTTFTFPQSLGVLGGRPGVSTYIVGVQDEKAFYLDPHEVQQVVEIKRENVDVDTSSYHCNVIRHIPMESIDPSLAIGFYCRDKNDFHDFCLRASDLIDRSDGAPLFTIAETRCSPKHPCTLKDETGDNDAISDPVPAGSEGCEEDDWQLL